MFIELGDSIREILEMKIYIPVISGILIGLGRHPLTLLDLFIWMAALAFTLTYKAMRGKTPFEDDVETKAIISASSWESLEALFQPSPNGKAMISKHVCETVLLLGHSMAGNIMMTAFALLDSEADSCSGNKFSLMETIAAIIAVGAPAMADALVPRSPIKSNIVKGISCATTGLTLFSKIITYSHMKHLAVKTTKIKGMVIDNGRATGAMINVIFILPALAVTGYHFYELQDEPKGHDRDAVIVNEVANLVGYISRVLYTAAVNITEANYRPDVVDLTLLATTVTAGLQTGQSFMPITMEMKQYEKPHTVYLICKKRC